MTASATHAGARTPTITAFDTKFVPGMVFDNRVKGVGLYDALTQKWPSDAHFAAYEPRTSPVMATASGALLRLAQEAKSEKQPSVYDVLGDLDVPNVRMVALVGDLDDPVAHADHTTARPEWRKEQQPRLKASKLAYYETRGGYRVLATLPGDGFEIQTRDDADQWKRLYLGWCAHIEQAHGLVLDRQCNDWTRLFRLPNVVRDGESVAAALRGTTRGQLPAFDVGQIDIGPEPIREHRPSIQTDDRLLACARAVAKLVPPSVEGHGGDLALFKAANELSTVLGDDASAIEGVLADTFNARCLPPWDPSKLRYEAVRAAERHQENPIHEWYRSHLLKDDAPADTDDTFGLGEDRGFDDACKPLDWLINGLQLAPGKVSLLSGYAGSAKTPTAALIAVCVAAGVPCLGHDVRRARVLYIAYEGGRNARRKMLRIAKGLGLDARQLDSEGWLTVLDGKALTDIRLEGLSAAIQAHDVGLVVLDTVTSALRASDVGRNDEAYARVLFDLGAISEETRCVVLGLSHDNKSAEGTNLRGVSGTSSIAESAQTVIRLEQDDSDRHLIKVSCARAPDSDFLPFGVRWVDGDGTVGDAVCAGVETPLRCELDDAVLQDRRGANASNQRKAAERMATMVEAAPRVLDAIKAGETTFEQFQQLAGDIAVNALRGVVARLKDGGALSYSGYGQYALATAWKSWPSPALAARARQIVEHQDG